MQGVIVLILVYFLCVPGPAYAVQLEEYTPDKTIRIEKLVSDDVVDRDMPQDGIQTHTRTPVTEQLEFYTSGNKNNTFFQQLQHGVTAATLVINAKRASFRATIQGAIKKRVSSVFSNVVYSMDTIVTSTKRFVISTTRSLASIATAAYKQIVSSASSLFRGTTHVQGTPTAPSASGDVMGTSTTTVPTPLAFTRQINSVHVPPPLSTPYAAEPTAYLSRFAVNPYHPDIPLKIKEVYEWDPIWNPQYNPHHYIQCTTYVAMVYNLNGISLKGKLKGNARDWIQLTDTYEVHASGASSSLPAPLDTVVWADRGMNHVGIVTAVESAGSNWNVHVINGNSTQEEYTFILSKQADGTYSITNEHLQTSAEAWVPSHWLRVKQPL